MDSSCEWVEIHREDQIRVAVVESSSSSVAFVESSSSKVWLLSNLQAQNVQIWVPESTRSSIYLTLHIEACDLEQNSWNMTSSILPWLIDESRPRCKLQNERLGLSDWEWTINAYLQHLVVRPVRSPFRVRDVDYSLQVFAKFHCERFVVNEGCLANTWCVYFYDADWEMGTTPPTTQRVWPSASMEQEQISTAVSWSSDTLPYPFHTRVILSIWLFHSAPDPYVNTVYTYVPLAIYDIMRRQVNEHDVY